jgi:ribosomal protein S18 acetylase RimI-like enzyme
MRRALKNDIPLLIRLMAEFYAESGYALDRAHASAAFETLLHDERLGNVWVIQADGLDVGHVVITHRFAMEYGGSIACIDDLYVAPAYRNRGLSVAALTEIRRACEASGIRAITVEVGHSNGAAQTVYRRLGLVEASDRQLLILALAAPAHVV